MPVVVTSCSSRRKQWKSRLTWPWRQQQYVLWTGCQLSTLREFEKRLTWSTWLMSRILPPEPAPESSVHSFSKMVQVELGEEGRLYPSISHLPENFADICFESCLWLVTPACHSTVTTRWHLFICIFCTCLKNTFHSIRSWQQGWQIFVFCFLSFFLMLPTRSGSSHKRRKGLLSIFTFLITRHWIYVLQKSQCKNELSYMKAWVDLN